MKLLFLLLIFSFQSIACPVSPEAMAGFKNRPHFKSQVINQSAYTEKDFLELIGRIRKVYDPIFEARGYEVKYLLYWDVEEGNAMTSEDKDKKKAYFMFSGGLLRAKHMTKDGFLYSACHEMGHHLGGFPKEKELAWCSTEGQADYFANLRCMKEILRDDPENAKARELKLPKNVIRKCEKQFLKEEDINICLRSTKAAEDAFRFLQEKELGRAADPSLLNQILLPVQETIMRYPDYACRAETGLQGALCYQQGELSDTDETAGVCHRKNGDRVGLRPDCWFKAGVE